MITSSYIQWTECNGIPRGEIIHEYEPLPNKYCVFTGHRKCSPKYAEDHIRLLLTEVIRNHEPDVFMIGMGPGADLLAAKILSEWNIRWQAIIPFEGHYTKWSMREKSLLDELLAYAEIIVHISPEYNRKCYAIRNNYMIERSHLCCAYWDGGTKGGTAMTVKLAESKGLDVIHFHPKHGLIVPDYQYSLFEEF
jgi:uncharacterized phage-like protein YoqJ